MSNKKIRDVKGYVYKLKQHISNLESEIEDIGILVDWIEEVIDKEMIK